MSVVMYPKQPAFPPPMSVVVHPKPPAFLPLPPPPIYAVKARKHTRPKRRRPHSSRRKRTRNVLQSKSKTLNVTPSKVTQPEYQHVGVQEPAVVSVVDVDLTKRIEINLETLDALLGELARICVDAMVVNGNTGSVLL